MGLERLPSSRLSESMRQASDMADEKIVTKKTAAKKTAQKQAATSAKSSTPAGASAAASDTASAKAAGPSAMPPKKAAPAKKTSAAAGSKKREVNAVLPGESPMSLRQLANVSVDERLAMTKEAAFYKAEKRNFAPGHEAEDWAAAEREIDELLSRAKTMTGF